MIRRICSDKNKCWELHREGRWNKDDGGKEGNLSVDLLVVSLVLLMGCCLWSWMGNCTVIWGFFILREGEGEGVVIYLSDSLNPPLPSFIKLPPCSPPKHYNPASTSASKESKRLYEIGKTSFNLSIIHHFLQHDDKKNFWSLSRRESGIRWGLGRELNAWRVDWFSKYQRNSSFHYLLA